MGELGIWIGQECFKIVFANVVLEYWNTPPSVLAHLKGKLKKYIFQAPPTNLNMVFVNVANVEYEISILLLELEGTQQFITANQIFLFTESKNIANQQYASP